MKNKALFAIVLLGAVASARGADVTISLSELEGTYDVQGWEYMAASQDIDFLAAAGLQDGGWVAPWNPIPLRIHMTVSVDPSIILRPGPGYTEIPRQIPVSEREMWEAVRQSNLENMIHTEVLPRVTIAGGPAPAHLGGYTHLEIEATGDEYTIDQEAELTTFSYPATWLDPACGGGYDMFTLRLDLYDGDTPLIWRPDRGTPDPYMTFDSFGSVTISDAYITFDGSLLAGTPLPEGLNTLPEPTTLLLLAVLAPAVLRRKRR